jgi:hypothetical protein
MAVTDITSGADRLGLHRMARTYVVHTRPDGDVEVTRKKRGPTLLGSLLLVAVLYAMTAAWWSQLAGDIVGIALLAWVLLHWLAGLANAKASGHKVVTDAP